MAATTNLSLFILIIISTHIPQSSSQSQNIETFYPFSPPPPPPPPEVPSTPPPNVVLPSFPPPASQPPRSSSKAAVGRSIGITAASTVVVSALLFFLLVRRSKRKREDRDRENASAVAAAVARDNLPPPPPQRGGSLSRFGSHVKGVIVDEDGLDVLYWRNMQEWEKKSSFKKKQYYNSLKDEEREEEKRIVSERKSNSKSRIQDAPLLRGKSSTSQSPVWIDDEIIEKAPSFSKQHSSSIKVIKYATPPLPPPPGAPKRLPPPTSQTLFAVEAVPKGKTADAPPPPPPPPRPLLAVSAVPKEKTAAPPPPPPPEVRKGEMIAPPTSSLKQPAAPIGAPKKRSSSAGEGPSNSQVKLKPLHWDKVNPKAVEHSMVWNKIDKGSFKFDGDLMEALFGYVATNRKSPQRDTRSSDKPGPPSQIFILDTRKSQNTAIVLKSLGVSRKEIIDALIEGRGLINDTVEKLTKIAPTDEEASQITAFDGDPTRLADAESFLYHLLKAVPSAFTRFNAMLFRSNYDSEVSSIKESLQSLESSCKELRTRGLFLKLLEAVLKAGNRLNAGTSRGNAQAFNLTALRKLSDVKSSDGKTTLLQFVVQEVIRAEGKRCVLNRNRSLNRTTSNGVGNQANQTGDKDDTEKEYMMLGLPVVGGLSAEFSNVKKAATLDYDVIVKTIGGLAGQVVEIRRAVAQCGSSDSGFARGMSDFLDTADLEIRVLKEEETRVMDLVKKTRDYYQAGYSKDKGGNSNPLQLFVIVRDFLGMVDQVCIDIARNVQKRKSGPSVAGSSSSASPGSPRVFRFPKLPANFMSDTSKSSSDSDDDNSEVR